MSCVIYVVLLFSLHECNGRSQGLFDKGYPNGKDLVQDVHNSNLYSTSTSLDLKHSKSEEIQAHKSDIAEAGQLKILATSGCAYSIKGKDSEAILYKNNYKAIEVAGSYPQEASTIEGWRRQTLSTLGAMTHNAEEPVDLKEEDFKGDVVVMDYAQPRRKPPIHNIKN